ncbi:MAG: hypothetical protein ACYS8Z_23440, partial [Planctomycetota bacterium]
MTETDAEKHIIPTGGGFLDDEPQHRTCWTLAPSISTAISGDIMVSNGKEYYEVRGFPIYANHSYFDPRKNGYTLFAATLNSQKAVPKRPANRKRRLSGRNVRVDPGKEKWRLNIPITGKALAMAGGVIFVAGEPMKF